MLSGFREALLDPELLRASRLSPTAFTRQRALTFPRLLALMLSGMCASVQSELDRLFATLAGESGRRREVSDRAFSQARRGFSAQAFDALRARLLEHLAPRLETQRWRGLRVVAADASRLHVSTRAGAQLTADHWAFALFLPGAEQTLHASLHPADASERQMLFEALECLEPQRDLLVLDRGYVGNATAAWLGQAGLRWCMRVEACGWGCVKTFLRSGLPEQQVMLKAPTRGQCAIYEIERRPSSVRLIRDVTPNGRVRVLMTNLLDAQAFPAEHFGALYHQRWRIEEAFKRIKHRLALEAVTGLTYLALQQDFAAKVLADNLCAALALADLPEQAATRPNRTYALGALRAILAACLLGAPRIRSALATTLAAIDRARCRIQPDRHSPRPPRPKPHKYSAYKTMS